MCSHTKQFQYNARPDAPDPIFAKQMQELPGRVKGEEVVCKYYNLSEGAHGAHGRWASGPSIDGKGEPEYVAELEAMGPEMVELDRPGRGAPLLESEAADAGLSFLRKERD